MEGYKVLPVVTFKHRISLSVTAPWCKGIASSIVKAVHSLAYDGRRSLNHCSVFVFTSSIYTDISLSMSHPDMVSLASQSLKHYLTNAEKLSQRNIISWSLAAESQNKRWPEDQ